MLLKYNNEAGAYPAPAIEKILYTNDCPLGRDASREGAFAVSGRLAVRISVPRRIGASGVVLRIAADGGMPADITLKLCETASDSDTYSTELDFSELCNDDKSGLFYYEFLLLRGWDTLFSDTVNNVDFELSKSSAGKFRLLIYRDDFRTPDWFKKKIIYHIFVDRYHKGKGNVSMRDGALIDNNWFEGIPQYGERPGAEVANNVFFGGNLWGITEKLEEISALGVGTIYLSPIFDAASNHKYDTGDYESTDSMFGGNDALDKLILAASEFGIKVILDGVFNHTGDDSRYFNRYGRYPETGAYQSMSSPYFGWYNFREYPDSYECWWNIRILPRLNLNNDSCREYFAGENGIGASYIKRGIGGWRLDVADELTDRFLDELRYSVKGASDGEAVIIGEVWENAADKTAYGQRRHYLQGAQLDSVMNYPLRNGIVDFVLHGDSEILYNVLTEIYSSYPRCVCDCLMNLLGTHDTERILTVLADVSTDAMTNDELATFRLDAGTDEKAVKRLKLASVIQYTVYGVPSLFYGDEAGIQGGHDPFCRMPYPWGRENAELLEHYRRLGRIRAEEIVFDGGNFAIIGHTCGLIVYERTSGNEKAVIAANSGDSEEVIELSGEWADILSGRRYTEKICIAPVSAVILKKCYAGTVGE